MSFTMADLVPSLWRAATQEEYMTQLNLSGRPSNNPQQKSAAEPEGESIKNQTVGALGALAMFAAVIVIGSCSGSSKPVAVQQPVQPAAPVSVPAVTPPAPPPAPVQAKASESKNQEAPGGHSLLRQPGVRSLFQLPAKLSAEDG